jgi:hypothetical protein
MSGTAPGTATALLPQKAAPVSGTALLPPIEREQCRAGTASLWGERSGAARHLAQPETASGVRSPRYLCDACRNRRPHLEA